MGDKSAIEWTDATWNPVTGCTKVSPGCKHCYAERLAERLQAMGNPRYRNGFAVSLHADVLSLPLRWRQPRRIFVNSMSDLFHEAIPDEFIAQIFSTMARAEQHQFQILTKRAERLAEPVLRYARAADVDAAQECRVAGHASAGGSARQEVSGRAFCNSGRVSCVSETKRVLASVFFGQVLYRR